PQAGGPWQYAVSGFSSADVRIFDIANRYTMTEIVSTTVTNNGGVFDLGFFDPSLANHEYLTLSATQIKTPLSVTLDSASNLKDPSNGADYIAISYGGFITNVQPLVALRQAQGLRVKVVDVQDVYDEFSDGLMDAQAIHD